MRELCYIAQAVFYLALVVVLITVDFFFMGLCLYIIAMYKELQLMLKCIDRESEDLEKHVDKAQYHRKLLRDSIEFHLLIIR